LSQLPRGHVSQMILILLIPHKMKKKKKKQKTKISILFYIFFLKKKLNNKIEVANHPYFGQEPPRMAS
jgi:hypothetical protein